MQNKIILFFSFLFFILLTLFSIRIPFFWDGVFFSETAVQFYKNGFGNLIPPIETDTGGFPLYSIFLTLGWKVFGKSLLVSHFILLPFLLGIVYQYFILAKRFLINQSLLFAMLLLLIEPTLMTQSVLMGYDLCVIFFFLWAINSLLVHKTKVYSLALTLLCLSSVRGSILGCSLLIIDIALNYSKSRNLKIKAIPYLLPFLFIFIWAFYHFQNIGWFFFSPERENNHEKVLPLSMMFRQLFFIGWKIADFGRIAQWLFLFLGSYYLLKKQTKTELPTVLKMLFIPLITLCLFMIPLANPIGHKYFIVVFLMLNIAICCLIQQIQNRKIQIIIFVLFFISLFTGNFWLYPERLGNGWDSSLKVIPYFHLKEEMDEFIKEEKIDIKQIGTQFPLIADKKYSHLIDSSYYYNNVWSGPTSKYNYFLFTNVINSDISNQIEETKNTWQLIKSLKSGQVYISLYKKK